MKTAIVTATLVLTCWAASTDIAGADPPAPAPEPKTTIDQDGTYSVGVDIAPGTYSSAGPVDDGACYWKRTSSHHGNDIIDNAMTKKPQVVQIEPTDIAFTTDGCQQWQRTDAVGEVPGDVPPLIAGIQLRHYMDILNGYAGQFGAPPLPGP